MNNNNFSIWLGKINIKYIFVVRNCLLYWDLYCIHVSTVFGHQSRKYLLNIYFCYKNIFLTENKLFYLFVIGKIYFFKKNKKISKFPGK